MEADRLDNISERELTGAQEIIASLLFAGSSYDHNIPMSTLGLQRWIQAMDLRFSGESLLPKRPHVFVPSSASSKVFGLTKELASGAELNTFFEEYQRLCVEGDVDEGRLEFEKTLKLQSLLVLRRICCAANKVPYICSLSDVAIDLWKPSPIQDEQLFIDLCCVIFEELGDQTFSQQLLLPILFKTFVNIVSFFHKSYFDLADGDRFPHSHLKFFIMSTKFMCRFPNFFRDAEEMCDFQLPSLQNGHAIEEVWDVECCSSFAELVSYLLVVVKTISPMLPSQLSHTLKCYYSHFIRLWFPTRTTSVLHAAIRDPFNNETVKLMLELGANPNAIDQNGRTPLHLLAGNEDIHWEQNVSMFKTLVDAGTHLDMAADDGKTILTVLEENVERFAKKDISPYLHSVPRTVFPLSCLCARVIGLEGIPYHEDRLPLHLQELVSRHCAA